MTKPKSARDRISDGISTAIAPKSRDQCPRPSVAGADGNDPNRDFEQHLSRSQDIPVDDIHPTSRGPRTSSNCEPAPTPSTIIPEHTEDDDKLALIREALLDIPKFLTIADIIPVYFAGSQAANLPGPLVTPAIASLADLANRHQLYHVTSRGDQRLHFLAQTVLDSTRQPAVITSSTTPKSFLAQYTGDCFRLEYLGLLYAIAARTSFVMLSKRDQDVEFLRRLFRASNICLTIAREVTAVNDAMVWLALEHVLLCTNIQGDLSEPAWRRIGDLTSDCLALGINRDSFNAHTTPFFLTEVRRGTFFKCHALDVKFSIHMRRPPRLFSQYADCKSPLDLSADEIVADPEELQTALEGLDDTGWSLQARFTPSTFRRARRKGIKLMEEVAQYEYRHIDDEAIAELKTLLHRSHEDYAAVPTHLKYDSSIWNSVLPSSVCVMRVMVLTDYLQSNLWICQAMAEVDSEAATWLVQAASDIMALVLELGNAKERNLIMKMEFSCDLLFHGVPSALILLSAVKKLSTASLSLPEGISRASILRSLSVFTDMLDNTAKIGDANEDMCRRAWNGISRSLDDLLNGPTLPTVTETALPPIAAGTAETDATAVVGGGGDLDWDINWNWEDFDMTTWMKGIEGVGMALGGEWSTFEPQSIL